MPPSYSPCPRPILKRTAASAPVRPPPQDEPSALLAIDPSILSPLVRFPHHQALAHTMGSALPYDRTPIVVTPNRCALPERGCPGRTYSLDDPNPAHLRSSKRMSLSPTRGKHLHPRAAGHDREAYEDNDLTPRQSPRVDHFPLPPLVPDLSSESSEESDGIASPPPEFYSTSAAHGKMSLEQSLMNLTLAGTNAPSSSALSFLPHPPSPRVRPSTSPTQPSSIPSSYPYAYSSFASNPSSSVSIGSSNPHSSSHGASSPVRSRSPASPTRSKRKSRPAPIPIPAGANPGSSPIAAYSHSSPTPTAAYPGAPASPERERRSRPRDDRGGDVRREHRERSRERRERERSERMARFSSSYRPGFAVEDAGCLGGF
ncbi:uncharacterized protein TRAVEDRAFT_73830 [Trametes versicolor FP-101664 SS1]|uniref:uncharacterized protein n=1 Tax=Trametes versicolor (strain FP-101664) TaxID=717944 RepID=UPI00046249A1|nr:uncharacterized protein TRAVEDRAFT_73830 [Trametes versicolor FP-101664 SS1]EIW54639.1 hypothetical protein TRAVEDRAFT_73830 [Trametes versicolor FP-101664 SS1]